MRTGDIGQRDIRGFLKLVGRTKDIIIRGGLNIAPAEVEQLLMLDKRVADIRRLPGLAGTVRLGGGEGRQRLRLRRGLECFMFSVEPSMEGGERAFYQRSAPWLEDESTSWPRLSASPRFSRPQR